MSNTFIKHPNGNFYRYDQSQVVTREMLQDNVVKAKELLEYAEGQLKEFDSLNEPPVQKEAVAPVSEPATVLSTSNIFIQ